MLFWASVMEITCRLLIACALNMQVNCGCLSQVYFYTSFNMYQQTGIYLNIHDLNLYLAVCSYPDSQDSLFCYGSRFTLQDNFIMKPCQPTRPFLLSPRVEKSTACHIWGILFLEHVSTVQSIKKAGYANDRVHFFTHHLAINLSFLPSVQPGPAPGNCECVQFSCFFLGSSNLIP